MTDNETINPLIEYLPPVLTITPPTLAFPLTPPLTPCSPCISSPHDSKSRSPSKFIQSPSSSSASPQTPISPTTSTPQTDGPNSLHFPLTRHLALLHPTTPTPIIHFIATRLLSPERPYGHHGTWTPIWEGCGDLSTAGVEFDAGKGCKRKEGEGKERDEKLKDMYKVARESYRLLEMKCPGVDKL